MKSFAAALLLLPTSALADPSLTIPPPLVDPAPSPSMWNGFYVGTGVTAAAIKGQKAAFGGEVFAGYDHEFQNNVVLGLRADTGYTPFATFSGRFQGFDYAMGEARIGYDFGRVTPYIYAGGGIARATAFPSELPDANATLNGVFGQGPGFGVTTLGAGFDYRLNDKITVGVSAGVIRAPGGGF
jgi:opacity protein-like surface antigen